MGQKFKKLTPNNNIAIDQVHLDMFNFAIKEKNINNVAITGNYGAGKSSFLETYKEHHNDKNKFLHISLAHFDSLNSKEKDNEDEDKIDENILERKITNQLLHQIDPKLIPLTEFKSKENNKKGHIIFWFALLFFRFYH